MQKGLSGGAPGAKRKKEVYTDFTPKADDSPAIVAVLQFKLQNFKDFSIKLKKENPQSFEELCKFSMQQKNMDRVISFVQENFTLMPQLEDRIF